LKKIAYDFDYNKKMISDFKVQDIQKKIKE